MECTFIYHRRHNDRLEKLLEEQKVTPTITLRHSGKMARIGRDVRLKGRKDINFAPELETTSIDNTLVRGTTFEYEGLD